MAEPLGDLMGLVSVPPNTRKASKVVGRHWSRAIFAGSRLLDLRDAASIWD